MKKILKSIKKNFKYILIIVLMCIIFAFINFFFKNKIQLIDNYIIELFNDVRNNNLTQLAKFITEFGDIIIFSIILLLMTFFSKSKKYAIYMVANLLFVFIINIIAKNSFRRTRPLNGLITENSFSFPSGHTMCSTAFYGLFLYLIISNTKSKLLKVIFVILFVFLILTIAFTRLYLNAHYLSDILGGLILGILCLITFIKILKDMEEK